MHAADCSTRTKIQTQVSECSPVNVVWRRANQQNQLIFKSVGRCMDCCFSRPIRNSKFSQLFNLFYYFEFISDCCFVDVWSLED